MKIIKYLEDYYLKYFPRTCLLDSSKMKQINKKVVLLK